MDSSVSKSSSPNGGDDEPKTPKESKKVQTAEETFGILDHAKREFALSGLDKKTSDYEGKVAVWVTELLEVFAKQGHSGNSAAVVVDVFKQLVNWGPLSPFTDNPKEWVEETDALLNEEQKSAGERIWQNQRSPSVMSMDAGKTWFRLDGQRRQDGSLEVFKSEQTNKEGNSEKSTGETAGKAGIESNTTEPKASKTNSQDDGGVQEKEKPGGDDASDRHGDEPSKAPVPKNS